MSSSPGDHRPPPERHDAWPPPPPLGARLPAGPGDETLVLGAGDTLHVIANADRWAQLTYTLAEAQVPLAVGDVDAMRRLAKLDQPVLDAVTRWIRTANIGQADPPRTIEH
ncbi:hypothetical protein [Kitasatospora sp. NPDC057223]|uniref:hypothetical protein n=1 Tax=Kitasatospora sp. NPDC057223 TaxID=3346055 RepID=UPI003637D09A